MTSVVHLRATPPGDVGQLLTLWADLEEQPRVLVQDDLAVLWANGAAHAALAKRRDVMTRGGLLAMADRANDRALSSFVRSATTSPSHWCLRRKDDDGHLLFRALRVEADDGSSAVGLVFHGTGDDFLPDWAGFKDAFALTTSEGQVVAALLDGETADMIGERLAISVDTVRTHIRNAYIKLGVNSREQMFRRLIPFFRGQQFDQPSLYRPISSG